jgi:hypothetical protein
MALRDRIEKGVNAVLLIGFVVLALGIGLWILSLSERFHASPETMLVVLGCTLLILGALAAKVFSRVES